LSGQNQNDVNGQDWRKKKREVRGGGREEEGIFYRLY
jgi:hypothetical protein